VISYRTCAALINQSEITTEKLIEIFYSFLVVVDANQSATDNPATHHWTQTVQIEQSPRGNANSVAKMHMNLLLQWPYVAGHCAVSLD